MAKAELARRMKDKARHDEEHREWVEEHTEEGPLEEIRQLLSAGRES